MEGEWWLGSRRSIILVEFRIKKWDKVGHQGVRVDSSSWSEGLGTAVLAQGERLSLKINDLAQTFISAWAWFPGGNVIS